MNLMNKNVDKFFNKNNIVKYFLSLILIITPLASVVIYIIITGQGLHLKSFIPQNINDEFGWWIQINAVVKKGMPLGYMGYNESRAMIGSLGPWSILTYYIYGIIGKIIGWNYYSMVWANWILLSFSLFIFVILVKPSNKQKIVAMITYLLCGAVTTYYSILSMSDSCRCSIGIIMISLIIYLIRKEKVGIVCKIIIFFVCFIGVSVYYPLIIFCYFLFYYLFKTKDKRLRFIISFVISLLILVLSFKFNNLFRAPYFDVSNLDIFIETFSNTKGIVNKLTYVFIFIGKGCSEFWINLSNMESYQVFYIFPFIVLCISIVEFIFNKTNRKYMLIAILSLIGFLLGNVILYEPSAIAKLVRILSSLYLPIYLMLSQTISHKVNKIIILVSTLLIIPRTINMIDSAIESQYIASKETTKINELKDYLSKYVFEIDETKSEWENTIDIYGYCNHARIYMLALPDGCGMSTMYEDVNPYLAKYALIEKGFAAEKQLLDQIPEAGFYKIFENDKYYIYRSMKYD